jgi:hypothetical protein
VRALELDTDTPKTFPARALRHSATWLLCQDSACLLKNTYAAPPQEGTPREDPAAVLARVDAMMRNRGGAGRGTDRVFSPSESQGGRPIDPKTTAVVLIEYQNEFCSEGGKLHDAVKGVMASNSMLENSIQLCDAARAAGCTIMHTPITFNADGSDNPNKGLGILKGCHDNSFFTRGTWNADFVEGMKPKGGDIVVEGKRGLGVPSVYLLYLLYWYKKYKF